MRINGINIREPELPRIRWRLHNILSEPSMAPLRDLLDEDQQYFLLKAVSVLEILEQKAIEAGKEKTSGVVG